MRAVHSVSNQFFPGTGLGSLAEMNRFLSHSRIGRKEDDSRFNNNSRMLFGIGLRRPHRGERRQDGFLHGEIGKIPQMTALRKDR